MYLKAFRLLSSPSTTTSFSASTGRVAIYWLILAHSLLLLSRLLLPPLLLRVTLHLGRSRPPCGYLFATRPWALEARLHGS